MLDLTREKGEPLFTSPRGKRIGVANWRHRTFTPAAEKIGMPDLHVHDLRHTAASLMIASGATPKDVQRSLGHKSAAVTLDIYAGHWDGALDQVAGRMDKMVD
ncbi:tyrosine-type recombinase/integrase [Propionicimonas sp.]|uniref:tyrosine-type recombinase/integrase n=1 Tax=Propionicimonas sp. TaxID=1955623 RepID=UPI0039E67438